MAKKSVPAYSSITPCENTNQESHTIPAISLTLVPGVQKQKITALCSATGSLMFSLGLLIYGDWFSSKVSFSHLVNIVGVAFCVSLELWKLETGVILHICHESHENSRVNFYRFNAKNWQFTVYFAVITQKNGNLLCILS